MPKFQLERLTKSVVGSLSYGTRVDVVRNLFHGLRIFYALPPPIKKIAKKMAA
jgi:hypothetical protein